VKSLSLPVDAKYQPLARLQTKQQSQLTATSAITRRNSSHQKSTASVVTVKKGEASISTVLLALPCDVAVSGRRPPRSALLATLDQRSVVDIVLKAN